MKISGVKSKTTTIVAALITAIGSLSITVAPAASGTEYLSKYKGQEGRAIKSLSEDDIRELSEGAGWGLAKAAELNGLPGPKHVLEMKKEIGLSSDQEERMEQLYKQMKAEAVQLGRQLIEQERELNDRFARKDIDDNMLDGLLREIAETYRALRYTHLSAHLTTPDILSEAQIIKYNGLRGYSSSDPCESVPEGHDPVMWRKHNNCE